MRSYVYVPRRRTARLARSRSRFTLSPSPYVYILYIRSTYLSFFPSLFRSLTSTFFRKFYRYIFSKKFSENFSFPFSFPKIFFLSFSYYVYILRIRLLFTRLRPGFSAIAENGRSFAAQFIKKMGKAFYGFSLYILYI